MVRRQTLSLAGYAILASQALHKLYPAGVPSSRLVPLLRGPATNVEHTPEGDRIIYPDGSSVLVEKTGLVRSAEILEATSMTDTALTGILAQVQLSPGDLAALSATVTGRMGGRTTAERMTEESRKERARKAAQARWHAKK